MFDFVVIQSILVCILGGKAGVHQIAICVAPLLQASIVVELKFFCNDERDNGVCKTLLEHKQAPDPSVAVLERMDTLKSAVEVDDVQLILFLFCIITKYW